MKVDLHCHTTASDGQLSPTELYERAVANGVELLAITDHDTIQGYLDLQSAKRQARLKLISGIEFSAVWGGATIHIVGLGVEVNAPCLQDALRQQNNARQARAITIGERLAKRGCAAAFAGAKRIAGASQIGRPHFAKYMVESGFVGSHADAFDKYLGAGKLGDVKAQWPQVTKVVDWICRSGGVAVLAHPGKYRMTNTKLRALLEAFNSAGGSALEVVSGMQNRDKTQHFSRLCEEFDLAASLGSDFHGPPSKWSDIGQMSPLPKACRPVYELLGL